MSLPPEDSTLKPPDLHQAERIRRTLERAGYSEPCILRLLKLGEWPAPRERMAALPLYLAHTREAAPLETLVRLFLLQQTVAPEAARTALAPAPIEEWAELGLVRVSPDGVAGAVELCPYGGRVVAVDWPSRREPDQVMSVAASSRALAQLTIRRRVGRALDLGTGCGIQALLAAEHSGQVYAVDSNPRAVRLTQFNAQLNGVSNITSRAGNLFEPVKGLTFDLIVCNPPFVIAPHAEFAHTNTGCGIL